MNFEVFKAVKTYRVMHCITRFQLMTDRINNGAPIRLYCNIIL